MNNEIDEFLDMAIILIQRGKIEKAKALLKDLVGRYPNDQKVLEEVPQIISFANRRLRNGDNESDE